MTLRPLEALQDRKLIRSRARSARFVLARINAPEVESGNPRPAVDISFVLDRSGSMAGGKIELAKLAVEKGIQRLSPRDSFSVVVYDQEIDIVVPATRAKATAKRAALSALQGVFARGQTNLSEGWLVGCGQVAEHLEEDRIGRCLLLTDGLANCGITEPTALALHAGELRARGVSTSTFGLGADYDEVLLGQMADAGGGAFTHIRSAEEIPALLERELGDTLEIAAREVVLVVRAPEGVHVSPVGPFSYESTDDGIRVRIPDLVSAQDFELPLRISFPSGREGEEITVEISVSDKEGVLGAEPELLTWAWASHTANDHEPRAREVDYVIAERYAAMAREEAASMNRDGQYRRAARALEAVAHRIQGYAGDDRKLRDIARDLARDAERYSREMSSMQRKMAYSVSHNLSRGGTSESTRKRRS
jgi:Ca-activated chloride channel family protein